MCRLRALETMKKTKNPRNAGKPRDAGEPEPDPVRNELPIEQGAVDVLEGAPVAGKAASAEAPGSQASQSQGEVARINGDSVEALTARIETLEDNMLRAKAECSNIQRRSANERIEAITYANADLMRSLLGVLDDLDRSLSSARKGDDPVSVIEGVKLVHANFTKALSDRGLEPIEALHLAFDPHFHEAIMQQPSDEYPPGTVLQEVAKGYKLRDRVIRPTQVIVSKAPDSA